MKKLTAFLFLVHLFFIPHLSAKAFHLLIMANTTDEEIKNSAKRDMKNVEDSFTYLSSISHIPLHMKKLTTNNRDLTREHILKWIHEETVASDDVIILYYSGHGCRTEMTPTIWPEAYFPDNYSAENIEFSEIIKKLINKRASLSFVLFDCCNMTMDQKGLPRAGAPDYFITYELKSSMLNK